MPGLIQHTSNQLDLLAKQLVKVVSKPLDSPFIQEIVVVPSVATRRWLSFQIAQDHGICANYQFPFLGDFVAKLVHQGAPAAAERMSFEAMIWRIDSLLQQSLTKREFAAVSRYLRDGDPLKRFHLSIQLATLFDQYGAYRLEMLSEWAGSNKKRTGDEAWQAILWQQLGQLPIFERTLERLRAEGFASVPELDLPDRVSVFAPASIPPAYLDLLFQLARQREVHLFVLRPSREYRGNDPTPKQRARRALTSSESPNGNPLTTSWGRVDVELTDLLIDKEEQHATKVTTGSEHFEDFSTDTLLGTLKTDILAAQNRGADSDDSSDAIPKAGVHRDDQSLAIHSCYSPMREVEVLYDQLLNCFETMPSLRPRDILVMTPAIEEYAPFIRAVFEYPEDESKRIPYSLADRHPRSESLTIDTFLSLLDLPGTRYTASEVFGLFGARSLRRRFRFSDEDLSLIRDWIDQTNIRWGIDGDHRHRLGLPDLEANTWRNGLKRLLLGYAMEGRNRSLFANILPHDEVEGDGADLLGRFVTAAEALFQLTEKLEHPRSLVEWIQPLTELIDQFFDPIGEEEVRDVRFLRVIINQLRTLREKNDTDEKVAFSVLRDYLEGQVARMEQHGHFFSTGVTFCALKPVRGIPARVVCLLGINDQIFPGRPQPAQFDLMAQKPEPGDPSTRHEDRYSFLQAVIAAKEKLLISYVGRSAIHNEEIPPSVVVGELLDYANQAFAFPEGKKAKQFLLTEHPLQAFSPRYFSTPREDERLSSYSEANAGASRIIHSAAVVEVQPFLGESLSQVALRDIELTELVEFWKNPCQHLLKNRLGLNLKDRGFSLDDNEPFEPSPLELYPLRQDLLAQELDGETLPDELFEARGILSSGVIGKLQLSAIRTEIIQLASKVKERIKEGKRDAPIDIDLDLSEYTLTGKIENIYAGQNVQFVPSKLSPKYYLRAWTEHLALCLQHEGEGRNTMLIARGGDVTFPPISSARKELKALCDLYLQGLSQPIPFFPRTSMAFAQAVQDRQKEPLKKARDKWFGQWGKFGRHEGEREDPYFELCFSGLDPFADPFETIAHKVFKTMLETMEPGE